MEHNPHYGLLPGTGKLLAQTKLRKAHFISNKSEASPLRDKHYRKNGKTPNKNLEVNVLQDVKELRSYSDPVY